MICIYGRYINPKQVVYVEDGKEKNTYRIVTTNGIITGRLRYNHGNRCRDTITDIASAIETGRNIYFN